jgi:predicted Fe-Mo cluster-binding NifX family protein
MKVAVPVWNQQISTVFDFSRRVMTARIRTGDISDTRYHDVHATTMVERTACLRDLNVDVLLCGAISLPLERMIVASGISVIPFLKGTVVEILDAYVSGHIVDSQFSLPGCRRSRWNCGAKQLRRRGAHGGRADIRKGRQ